MAATPVPRPARPERTVVSPRRLIAFDLDGTLAVSKSPISAPIAELLRQLIHRYDVCVISGGAFPQFQVQVLDRLDLDEAARARLHLLPTSGTRYHRYVPARQRWELQYSNDLSAAERQGAIDALHDGAVELGMWETEPFGDVIEDRGSQITFSALGQHAPPEVKERWDPDGAKKLALQCNVAERLPQHEVRAGGATSIDVTRRGADKGVGMLTLLDLLELDASDVLFFGDQVGIGGNDHAVVTVGIDTIAVRDPSDTALALTAIVAVTDGGASLAGPVA